MSNPTYTKADALASARERFSRCGKNPADFEKNEISKRTAFRHGRPWSIGEIDVLIRWSGTDLELASQLCRTYYAVRQARNKLQFCKSFGHAEVNRPTTERS